MPWSIVQQKLSPKKGMKHPCCLTTGKMSVTAVGYVNAGGPLHSAYGDLECEDNAF